MYIIFIINVWVKVIFYIIVLFEVEGIKEIVYLESYK